MLCPKCNHEQADGSNFCASCGKRINSREWTLSGLMIGGIVLTLLALGGLGGWLVFAPAKNVQNQTATAQSPEPAPGSPTIQLKPSAGVSLSASPTIRQTVRTVGPETFRLQAHQSRTIPFTVPSDAPDAILETAFNSGGGVGGHLHVLVFRNLVKVFDSGNTVNTRFSVPVLPGDYSIIVQNTAMLLPRDIAMAAKITAFRK